jgi:DNA-binding GntR family transcriptional regulator
LNRTLEADATTDGTTVAERVLATIQEAIVRGDVAPGARLSEPELARRYGVSRGPLREALQRLEARRLVEREPHVGARVAALTFERLIDLARAREALEGMACRLATEQCTDAELDALEALLDDHAARGELREGRGYFQKEGDLDFHYRIAQGSRNALVAHLLCDELYHLTRMYRYKFSGYEGRSAQALAEHRAIVAAMRERDADFAELLMRRHVAASRRNIEAAHRRALASGRDSATDTHQNDTDRQEGSA